MSQTIEQLKEQLSCLSVSRHGWTPRRTGSRKEKKIFSEAIHTDESLVGTYKKVIDDKMSEWKHLMEAWHAPMYWWKINSFPYVYKGMGLFQKERRKEIVEKLTQYNFLIKEKASALDAIRKQILAWAKEKYPTTYDESVYPPSWRDCFGVTWQEHSIDPPAYLERDDAEEYQRELQRTLGNLSYGMRQFEQECYSRLAQLSIGLTHSLSNGSNKGLTPNVKGLADLYDRVQRMRFEGTEAFKVCLEEAKALIDGVELTDLKKKGGLRQDVKERLQAIVQRNAVLREKVAQRAKEKQP